jgi:hypothetical protein
VGVNVDAMENMIIDLISRGLGLYGRERMDMICKDSGISVLGSSTSFWATEDPERATNLFLINYSKFSVAARMTVLIFTKKHGFPLPQELKSKRRRKSRLGKIRDS